MKLDIAGTNRLVTPRSPRPPLWFWGRFDDKPGADALALDPSRMGWIASAGRGELRQYGAYAR